MKSRDSRLAPYGGADQKASRAGGGARVVQGGLEGVEGQKPDSRFWATAKRLGSSSPGVRNAGSTALQRGRCRSACPGRRRFLKAQYDTCDSGLLRAPRI